jgi:predicted CXXCH cytochrome family protein
MTRSLLPLVLVLAANPAWAGIPAEQEDCLGCHTDPSQTFDLASGEKLSLYVDQAAFAKSVHGETLRCTECHSDKKSDHATGELKFKTRRDVTRTYYEQCKGCHFANYTKTLDGVHFAVMAKGNDKAALCVDCHGAHDISRPGQPRTRISKMCSGCHAKEAEIYAKSVHGRAAETSPDVPVCTDCHGVHDIQKSSDPTSTVMSANLQRTCAKCHQGASASFPKAWLSHYEPTPQKAPIVWGVQLFYKLMIPFMVGGLVLQIALHLWRVVVNR